MVDSHAYASATPLFSTLCLNYYLFSYLCLSHLVKNVGYAVTFLLIFVHPRFSAFYLLCLIDTSGITTLLLVVCHHFSLELPSLASQYFWFTHLLHILITCDIYRKMRRSAPKCVDDFMVGIFAFILCLFLSLQVNVLIPNPPYSTHFRKFYSVENNKTFSFFFFFRTNTGPLYICLLAFCLFYIGGVISRYFAGEVENGSRYWIIIFSVYWKRRGSDPFIAVVLFFEKPRSIIKIEINDASRRHSINGNSPNVLIADIWIWHDLERC